MLCVIARRRQDGQRLCRVYVCAVSYAGQDASVILMIVYIVAIHNSVVFLLLFGLPFDRALPWHKMLAFSSIFNSLIHMASFYVGGRAHTMEYARAAKHHMFKHITKAYGMEVTGASDRLRIVCAGNRCTCFPGSDMQLCISVCASAG